MYGSFFHVAFLVTGRKNRWKLFIDFMCSNDAKKDPSYNDNAIESLMAMLKSLYK